jgi:hypothetical protein
MSGDSRVYRPNFGHLERIDPRFRRKRQNRLRLVAGQAGEVVVDLSKLPRLSNSTDSTPPNAPEPEATTPIPADVATQSTTARHQTFVADSWLSIAIGLILLLISPRIWQYLFSKSLGTPFTWTFSDPAGNPLPYSQTVFFPGDIAFAAFAISMIIEGLVVAIARRPVTIAASLALTILATVLNLGYVVYMMQKGYGFQLYSGLATAFGGYIAVYQSQIFKAMQPSRK